MTLKIAVELVAVFIVRLMAAAGILVFSYVLSSHGGAEIVGEFLRVFAYSLGVGLIIRFGADYYLVRHIGRYGFSIENSSSQITSVLLTIIVASVALLTISAVIGGGNFFLENERMVLIFACLLAVNYVLSAVFKGLKKAYFSPLLESGFCLLLISIFAALGIYTGVYHTADELFAFGIIAASMQAILASVLLKLYRANYPLRSPRWQELKQHILESGSYFPIVVLGFLSEWGPIVILGLVWTSEALGVWSVLYKSSYMIIFALAVVNAMMSARYAYLQKISMAALSAMACRVTFSLWLLAVPLISAVVVFADDLLTLFGPDYVLFRDAFLVLVVAQAVNLGTGSCGDLLNMSGHQKANAFIAVASTSVSTVGAVWVATVGGGVIEMAIVVSIAVVIKNVGQFLAVKLKLGFWCLPVPWKVWRLA